MSGRRKFMDDDEDRLPAGMKRIGYDEGTQRYMFSEGSQLWLGEPGSFYGGTLKRAGGVPAANSANVQPEDDEEYFSGDDSDDPVPAYSEHEIPRKKPSRPRPLATNDWGVPIASISSTDARPPDSTGPGATLKRRASRFKNAAVSTVEATNVGSGAALKRRASRFKDAAASTVVATGVVRSLTGKKKFIKRVQQNPAEVDETKHDAEGEQDSARQANV